MALLKGMFPQFNEDRLRQTLAYHRGNVDQAATELLSGGTTPVHAPPPATAEWACATCTFANAASSQQCAMCDSPNPTRETEASPLRVSAPSTPPPSEATTGEERVVPPWWNTFWREHQSTVTCDERMAKEILFTGGRFKNSEILTLDVKSRVLRLLGGEEVHTIATDSCTDAYASPGHHFGRRGGKR